MLWGYGSSGLTLLWMVVSSLLLAGAITAIVSLARWQRGRRQQADYTAFEILAARYARGEIDDTTFAAMRARLFEQHAGARR